MYADQKSKKCKVCGFDKELSMFYITKKGYFMGSCKQCVGDKSKKYYSDNRDTLNERRALYQRKYLSIPENKLKKKKLTQRWIAHNLEKRRESNLKAYYKNPKRSLANGRNYFARKLNATPKWLSRKQLDEMKNIYLNCPEGFHVDHIIPLKGKNVRGLHVPWNLQYLPAKENLQKSNRVAA